MEFHGRYNAGTTAASLTSSLFSPFLFRLVLRRCCSFRDAPPLIFPSATQLDSRPPAPDAPEILCNCNRRISRGEPSPSPPLPSPPPRLPRAIRANVFTRNRALVRRRDREQKKLPGAKRGRGKRNRDRLDYNRSVSIHCNQWRNCFEQWKSYVKPPAMPCGEGGEEGDGRGEAVVPLYSISRRNLFVF